MEYLKLIGVVIIVVGFLFKKDTLATVVVAGIATGLIAGLSPMELLTLLGESFTSQRVATLFILTLPVVGVCERYGLKEKAVDLIGSVKKATTGTVLSLYQTLRTVAIAFSVQLGGHPQFVRPLIAPMAEGASEAKYGSLTETQRDTIKGAAASADNFGNFFAQNLFLGAPGVLLIVTTMAEQGYEQVTPLAVAMWSIPVAIISLVFGLVRNVLLDRKLSRTAASGTTTATAPTAGTAEGGRA